MRNGTAWCLAIIIIAGNIIGIGIGYVSVVIQSYSDATNCTRISMQPNFEDVKYDCEWSDDRICRWNGSTCQFRAPVTDNSSCYNITDRTFCEAQEQSCIWTRPRGSITERCRYQMGWDKTNTALVGTLATIGGIVGSLLVHIAITRAGINHTIVLCGFVSTLAAAFQIIGWHSTHDTPRLALLLTGRFCSGIALGMASAAVPMYVGDVATREVAGVLGVGFQVCITFGIMTASLIGFAANPTMTSMHPRTGVIILNYYYLAMSILLIPVAFFADKPLFDDAMRSSLLTFRHSAFLRIQPGGASHDYGNAPEAEASLFRRPLYVAVAILVAAAQQLSGINAVMSFCATMAADIGMENPYMSAFILFMWNFVSTLVAIYFAYRMTAGNMFLAGEFGVALSCFIIAVPIYCFDESASAPQAIIILGIFLFIFLFEVSMGPTFYVLSTAMFPSELRSAGCSFTIFCQFICNALVTFVYPLLVESFSGGPSRPQDIGIGAMFFVFGSMGVILTFLLKIVMTRIKEEHGLGSEMNGVDDEGVTETKENLTMYEN